MTEPTIKQRLAGLRTRLVELKWAAADPMATIGLPLNEAVATMFKAERESKNAEREIARLEEYERLGYEHEPNF